MTHKCRICRSFAINPHLCGRDPGVDLDLCDVCYWRDRADRIAELEAENARLREYVLADTYCPCCGDNGPEHGEGCDYRDERMEAARAALAKEE